MSEHLDTVAQRDQTSGAARAPDQRPRGLGWRRLQMLGGVGVVGSLLLSMVIALSLEPFLVAMAAPFVVGLVLVLRWPRIGVIWLGVSSLGLLLFSAPFLAEALTHPESFTDFFPLVIFAVSLLVGIVAAVPSFRQGRGPSGASAVPRAIAVGAGAAILAASVVGIVAFVGTESVPPQVGDIRVVTENLLFHPTEFAAESGEISVHVTNRDTTRHTFTIDQLDIDLNVPPNTTQRISFSAGPGTYRFYCRPHGPGMEGELVVG